MRINKMLSNKGICSRKDARRLIDAQRVIVNGEFCIQGQWVEEYDNILVDNQPLESKEKVYFALNKPKGITCTLSDEVENNIISYMNYAEYIFPVGRLDKESQGLIIMTNDGDFANKILDAKNEHEKEYIVTVNKPYDEKFLETMSNGVEILDTVTRKCRINRVDEHTFNIILTQGLNKQIRRMCKVLGYSVVKLERIRIMNLKIEGIEYGEWKKFDPNEIVF